MKPHFIRPRVRTAARRASRWWVAVLGAAAIGGWTPVLPGASFTDPSTTFYGKVIGSAAEQPFLVTQGDLEWTIRRADGLDVTLTTTLFPLHQGEYSYRLEVPHEVLASGLNASAGTVPISPSEQTHAHFIITVDGFLARILGPGGVAFDLDQARRAGTHRLDLEVPLDAVDADGNGLPDWWEAQFGLQDATADPDGDGWDNRKEFLNGTNPGQDDRVPSLLTRETRVYAEGVTALLWQSADSDSSPSQVAFNLTEAPGLGQLLLRNAGAEHERGDRILSVGDSFTQEDMDAGRLIFVHDGSDSPLSTKCVVSLSDENPEHGPASGTIWMHVYRPGHPAASTPPSLIDAQGRAHWPELSDAGAGELPWDGSYYFSRDAGYHVRDAYGIVGAAIMSTPSSAYDAANYESDYVPLYGRDQRHLLLGSSGQDRLQGGMEDDILVGGRGHDTMRGGGGADLVVFFYGEEGSDELEDFNPVEGDVLDLSRVLRGVSSSLNDYVTLAAVSGGSELRIDAEGDGSGTDLTVTLSGVASSPASLQEWWSSGAIEVGDKEMTPLVTIAATVPVASENEAQPGVVTVTRSGSADMWLTVGLLISGSAVNGVDYEYIDAQVTMAAGVSSVDIPIRPYVDTVTELAEVVDVRLLAGEGYELGLPATARVTIEDLAPSISLEVLEPLAVKSTLQPAYLLVTRTGVIDRSVLVRLDIGGSAVNGTDYETVPSFLNFDQNQTTLLIPITPRSSGSLSGGAESISVRVRPDPTYRLGAPAQAHFMIVDTLMTFVGWMQTAFPDVTEPPQVFAEGDYGQQGVRNLARYAYQLNPLAPHESPELLPSFAIQEGKFSVMIRRPAAISDVLYVVEVSEDLQTWHGGIQYVEPYYPLEFAGDLNVVAYRAVMGADVMPRQFMRVRVVYAP